MLDIIEQVHSTKSPPALSLDTPIVSDNLPVTNPLFFQDSEDMMDDDEDLIVDYQVPPWREDDTVD